MLLDISRYCGFGSRVELVSRLCSNVAGPAIFRCRHGRAVCVGLNAWRALRVGRCRWPAAAESRCRERRMQIASAAPPSRDSWSLPGPGGEIRRLCFIYNTSTAHAVSSVLHRPIEAAVARRRSAAGRAFCGLVARRGGKRMVLHRPLHVGLIHQSLPLDAQRYLGRAGRLADQCTGLRACLLWLMVHGSFARQYNWKEL